MKVNFSDFVEYDTTSPTFLVWKVDVYSGRYYSILEKEKGEVAGSVISSSGYAQVKIQKKLYLCHRIIWELHNGEIPEGMFIDHLDGNRLNNTLENLRLTTRQGNARNSKKRKDNTSGLTGVHLMHNRYKSGNVISYWCGSYMEDGKYFSKRFSIKKLGYDVALASATEFRGNKVAYLNEGAVAFTDRHGK